nr:hypothetical protein [uncultured Fluviicola sp.]
MNGLYLIFIGIFLSFNSTAQNMVNEPKGNFGGDGKNAPSLQLNENHTFVYTDLTKASKPIVAEGTWSIESNELILNPDSKARLNKHYTLIREGLCIKTRKNLAFYTLCNCK